MHCTIYRSVRKENAPSLTGFFLLLRKDAMSAMSCFPQEASPFVPIFSFPFILFICTDDGSAKTTLTSAIESYYSVKLTLSISNGNRTSCRPIRSVIIRVINKIGRPPNGSPICLITSMITDRIERHEVLLPLNHNFNEICDM